MCCSHRYPLGFDDVHIIEVEFYFVFYVPVIFNGIAQATHCRFVRILESQLHRCKAYEFYTHMDLLQGEVDSL